MNPNITKISGGVTAPSGFVAGAASCGIKNPKAKRNDLVIVASEDPCTAAAVFTSSKVKAAPVRVSATHVRDGDLQAVITNSGNANACTGPRGITDAKAMAKETAEAMGINMRQVGVCSTGIIGVPLPIDRITPRIPDLVKSLHGKGSDEAAKAMMTSDTVPKSASVEVNIGSKKIRIGAVAKGAGMICPNMATMICIVTTDAKIGKAELQKATRLAADETFNRISVDGDMSTNDTVFVLANGRAGNRKIKAGSPSCQAFRAALTQVMMDLAKAIVRDGEKVTKFVELNVRGAPTFLDAKKVAEAVGNSLLVKCSWNGSDPNWGRIMHAIGYSKARFREELIDIYFGGLAACKNGLATETPMTQLTRIVSKREFTITIDLNLGDAEYTLYTNDISEAYVDYNRSEYSILEHKQRTGA